MSLGRTSKLNAWATTVAFRRQPAGWEIEMAVDRLENIVSLAKRRGFVYPSSEI